MKEVMRETKCLDCGYQSITHGSNECSKCGGKLEILASTNREEVELNKKGDEE